MTGGDFRARKLKFLENLGTLNRRDSTFWFDCCNGLKSTDSEPTQRSVDRYRFTLKEDLWYDFYLLWAISGITSFINKYRSLVNSCSGYDAADKYKQIWPCSTQCMKASWNAIWYSRDRGVPWRKPWNDTTTLRKVQRKVLLVMPLGVCEPNM
jgi:hypothetical protein